MINVDVLKSKIAELNEIDSQRRVFASDSHQYKYNPCLQEEDIILFEKTHEIELPNDYKEFLLKIGNGGAGPGYGVLPLNKFNQIQGSITLCSHGCGLYDILIVSGPQRGKVWYEFRNENHGMGPIASSFTEWYENWLDKSIKEIKKFWDKRDLMAGTVKKISASGYGRKITVKLIHNKKRITFDFSQTDEFINKGQKSQKIKLNDIIYFSLYIDNVLPDKTDRKYSVKRKGWSTQYSITSYVQKIIDNRSFLCCMDKISKSIMIITPNEISLQLGDKFKVSGTINSEIYKVE